jgi:membrane protease YdiL (CAAX protease family)
MEGASQAEPTLETQRLVQQLWAFAPLALLVLAWAGRRGWLRPAVLTPAPERPSRLRGWDVLAGLGLILAGRALMRGMLELGVLARPVGEAPSVGFMLAAQGIVFAPPFFFALARGGRGLGLWAAAPAREARLGVLAAVAALTVIHALNATVALIGMRFGAPAPSEGHQLLPLVREMPLGPRLLGLVLLIAVLAPVLEEAVFRGLFQTALRRLTGSAWAAVLLLSLGFTAMHFAVVDWQMAPGLFVLSGVLGVLYERRASLVPAVVAHAVFNAANMVLVRYVLV